MTDSKDLDIPEEIPLDIPDVNWPLELPESELPVLQPLPPLSDELPRLIAVPPLPLPSKTLKDISAMGPIGIDFSTMFNNKERVLLVKCDKGYREDKNPIYVNNCKICKKPHKSFIELEECYYSHFNPYECFDPKCCVTFKTKEAQLKHYQEAHDKKGSIIVRCDTCGNELKTLQDLANHQELHTREMESLRVYFSCKLCGLNSINYKSFIDHGSMHKNCTISDYKIDESIPRPFLPDDIRKVRDEQLDIKIREGDRAKALKAEWEKKEQEYIQMLIPSESDKPPKIEPISTDVKCSSPRKSPRKIVGKKAKGKKSSGEDRKKEMAIYLCIECLKRFRRKKSAIKHDDGNEDCKEVYHAKVKQFPDEKTAESWWYKLDFAKNDEKMKRSIISNLEGELGALVIVRE